MKEKKNREKYKHEIQMVSVHAKHRVCLNVRSEKKRLYVLCVHVVKIAKDISFQSSKIGRTKLKYAQNVQIQPEK